MSNNPIGIMTEIDLIPGVKDPSAPAAISREKMEEMGADSMSLSQALSEMLAPLVGILNEGCGLALVNRGGETSIIGLSLSNWNTDLEAAKTQGRVLLCVNLDGNRGVRFVGCVGRWYNEAWVADNVHMPKYANIVGWMPLPDPMPATEDA